MIAQKKNTRNFAWSFLVIKILRCWFNLPVLQEMLLPWHALWGCECGMQCPPKLLLCHRHSQCLELALTWLLPHPQASCWFFPGSQSLPGFFSLPFCSPRLWGCISTRAQQQWVMMPDPTRLQSQFPVLWESLATLPQGHPVAGLVQNQEKRMGKMLSSGTELCWRWHPMETGITWVLEL